MTVNQGKQNILELGHDELVAAISDLGQPMFRVKQLEEWLWSHRVRSFDEMTNLPKKLREDLGLNSEVTVVGMDTRVEIWDKDTFSAFMEQQKQASVAEALELLRL